MAFVPGPDTAVSPGRAKPLDRPTGEILARASGGAFVLEKARLSAAGVSLNALGTVGRDGRLDGRYALEVESIPATFRSLRLSGLASVRTDGLVPDPESSAGSISIAGTIGGRLTAPAVIAKVEIPELTLRAFRAANVSADIQADPSKLIVDGLAGTIAGGTVRGSGALALATSNSAAPRERFVIELEGVDLAGLSALLPEPWSKGTEGRFTGKAEISPIKSLAGRACETMLVEWALNKVSATINPAATTWNTLVYTMLSALTISYWPCPSPPSGATSWVNSF